MIKPLSVSQTKEVVSKFDTEKEKTIWTIKPIDAIEFAEIEDAITTTEYGDKQARQRINYATKRINLLRKGLVSIKGKGWPKDVNDEVIRLMPKDIIMELADLIEDLSTLTDNEQEGLQV